MEENINAVEQGVEQTTNTESAPVETNNVEESVQSTTQQDAPGETETASTEQQSNTSQAVPYDRFKEVNDKAKALSQELESYKSKAELLDRLQSDPDLAKSVLQNVNLSKQETGQVDPQVQEAYEVLKGLGMMTREEYAAERAQQEVVSHFQNQVDELSKKYDGSDGSPAFNAEQVADYMDNNGIIWGKDGKPDVEAVHFLLNREALIDAQAKKIRSSSYTEKSGSSSSAPDDVQGLINEARQKGDFSNVFKTFLKK